MKHLFALLLILPFTQVTAERVTEIYQPSYKSAAQLQQTLSTLYDNEASIVAHDEQLIIRAEEKLVNQIQELLLQLDKIARRFSIAISSTPTAGNIKTYSTRRNHLQTFNINDGKTLTIAKEQREQKLSKLGWLMLEVNEFPSQQEAMSIHLKSIGSTVTLEIVVQTLTNGEFKTLSNTVQGELNEWIAVASDSQQHNQLKKKTERQNNQEIYIRVSEQ